MKQLLTILFLLVTFTTFAQVQGVHKAFPVKILDSLHAIDSVNALNPSLKLDTTFRQPPIWLDVTVTDVANFTAYQIQSTLTYKDDFTAPYTAKNTQTASVLIVPNTMMDFPGAINHATGRLIISKLNAIIKIFGLQADPASPLNTGDIFDTN